MSKQNTQFQNAAAQLRTFLQANQMRCTKERLAILETIYETDKPFTIDDLMEMMVQKRFLVSMATLYAATDLFARANLLLRHPAPTASALFQRIPDSRTSCYLICNSCHKVTTLDKKDVTELIESIPTKRFSPSHRITYIYGLCTRCKTKQKRQLEKQKKY